eukprot:TRINITY_DN8499_c0_g2_i2.p1 TRINITY_DN8499_c0_g2~~TRINITY_DN8499_c0_g2_i2.p1  ORF type:complete len:454 (-),score=77.85 TRINITY_DN8499_c0_g2_i2:220-1581(-)
MNVINLDEYDSFEPVVEDKGIYRAIHVASGKSHIIKKLHLKSLKEIDDYYTEVIVHSRLVPHPNVVQIYGRCLKFYEPDVRLKTQQADLYIALEVMEKTLGDEIKGRSSPYTREEFEKIAGDILTGLLHMEEQLVWHRDLKPANILVKEKTYKLADFGGSKASVQQTIASQTILGTPNYWSPEMEKSYHSGTWAKRSFAECLSSDVYSLGLVLMHVALLEHPRSYGGDVQDVIAQRYGKEVSGLLEEMTALNPEQRPTFVEIARRLKLKPTVEQRVVRRDVDEEEKTQLMRSKVPQAPIKTAPALITMTPVQVPMEEIRIDWERSRITDDELIKKISSIGEDKKLTYLNLGSCSNIGDAGVIAIVNLPQLAYLRTLKLGQTRITDASLKAIAASPSLNNLEELSLRYCKQISDAGVAAIANAPQFTALRTLNIYHTNINGHLRGSLKGKFKID